MTLSSKISRLRNSLDEIEKKGIDLSKKTDTAKSFYDFKERKEGYYISSFEGMLNDLKKDINSIAAECKEEDAILDLIMLVKDLDKSRTEPSRMRRILNELEGKASKIKLPQKTDKGMSIDIPSLPEEIKEDITADLSEIEKCFNSGLYRSATILCGRVLETTLHRKYYEATGVDILEKSPGIGLGNLIAKLRDKDVKLDPAITQQIHLINNVRIFSVHKKQEAFMPSHGQANAIILYTVDVLGKMWN
ncbi:DUF4145 domain-containing protein [Candidatus Woesearchaeota archaeon]|nr:DUF4145 domain-containing protein [Candidatus Woesearchaeota archaeon]